MVAVQFKSVKCLKYKNGIRPIDKPETICVHVFTHTKGAMHVKTQNLAGNKTTN